MNDLYRGRLKQRTASAAIGASTIRRLAKAGTIGTARRFLEQVDLGRLVAPSAEDFQAELDRVTADFQTKVAISWGASRKFLNIYFRDCLYNEWLRDDFGLSRIEEWLEVPLDAHVAKGLKAEASVKDLPRWLGVSQLDAKTSVRYQDAASKVAEGEGVARVHLDIKYWRQ